MQDLHYYARIKGERKDSEDSEDTESWLYVGDDRYDSTHIYKDHG